MCQPSEMHKTCATRQLSTVRPKSTMPPIRARHVLHAPPRPSRRDASAITRCHMSHRARGRTPSQSRTAMCFIHLRRARGRQLRQSRVATWRSFSDHARRMRLCSAGTACRPVIRDPLTRWPRVESPPPVSAIVMPYNRMPGSSSGRPNPHQKHKNSVFAQFFTLSTFFTSVLRINDSNTRQGCPKAADHEANSNIRIRVSTESLAIVDELLLYWNLVDTGRVLDDLEEVPTKS